MKKIGHIFKTYNLVRSKILTKGEDWAHISFESAHKCFKRWEANHQFFKMLYEKKDNTVADQVFWFLKKNDFYVLK